MNRIEKYTNIDNYDRQVAKNIVAYTFIDGKRFYFFLAVYFQKLETCAKSIVVISLDNNIFQLLI